MGWRQNRELDATRRTLAAVRGECERDKTIVDLTRLMLDASTPQNVQADVRAVVAWMLKPQEKK